MAGCTAATSFYPSCSPKSLGATQGVWEALGYKISEGIIDITWEFERAGKRPRLKRTESELGGMLPERFRHRKLCAATGDFGAGSKLGQGGSGSVFKGVLPDGRLVAVKRIGGSGKQFRAEVMAVGRIHHLNLVRLLWFCIKSPLHFLVYEFMPNGSLDSWIFGKGRYLDWSSRVSIAMDVARGLAYLHDSCREKIFHLDIKPQNILLDGKMRAKISDFGFAKIVDKDKSQTITGLHGARVAPFHDHRQDRRLQLRCGFDRAGFDTAISRIFWHSTSTKLGSLLSLGSIRLLWESAWISTSSTPAK
ncbi:G-type lectin S-receptor-like serine/threonine-protein kinase SD2-5 [Selaginella moellendorffii]|uniref:G-type lectin S-receptor-like serine/threonine-protein kinase SD2-5 n=1 Tax=Selaginella moellendorffii TaxID=88036 RepID=UPI000D1C9290|nr:G-type lectin S-receptor-like serine/threonine-protein kinase SD2-5 [Selaginella moellendorffii]|eukprot:XP_024519379.1 G-type lectin S-receptor-like serine/threonine-protein kinase SD2-5 [Selaginella moellendorffii]